MSSWRFAAGKANRFWGSASLICLLAGFSFGSNGAPAAVSKGEEWQIDYNSSFAGIMQIKFCDKSLAMRLEKMGLFIIAQAPKWDCHVYNELNKRCMVMTREQMKEKFTSGKQVRAGDGTDLKDGKGGKDGKGANDPKSAKDGKHSKDSKESKDAKDGKSSKTNVGNAKNGESSKPGKDPEQVRLSEALAKRSKKIDPLTLQTVDLHVQEKILGLTTDKIELRSKLESGKTRTAMQIWVTKAIDIPEQCLSIMRTVLRIPQGLQGTPLKLLHFQDSTGQMVQDLAAIKVAKVKPNAADFKLLDGYKEVKNEVNLMLDDEGDDSGAAGLMGPEK